MRRCRTVVALARLAVVAGSLLMFWGCSSDDDSTPLVTATPTESAASTPTPTVTPSPGVQQGSLFIPVPAPLSVDSRSAAIRRGNGGETSQLAAAQSTTSGITRWFYLVNGQGLPTPLAPGMTAPAPEVTPQVLAVTGSPAQGAPNPNGGTIVGTVPLAPDSSSAQLWKAIDAGNGTFYLRSAQSFATSTQQPLGSVLLGYGATYAAFDLGTFAGTAAALSWNQSESPNGDQSDFQRWSYESDSSSEHATQISSNDGGELFASDGSVGVSTGTSAPEDQWYFFPNYLLDAVLAQPNSEPPFPTFDSDGACESACAAYNYISSLYGGAAQSCDLEGTEYTGVRCQYIIQGSANLASCASDLLSVSNPGSYDDTAITDSDWASVSAQIATECQYAANVQAVFANLSDILTNVFALSGDEIDSLAIDVGASSGGSITTVAIEVIEGLMYTALSASGVPAGIVANLMSTAVNAALAVPGNTLTSPLVTTVENLYDDLEESFSTLTTGGANAEQSILSDWGRLQQIGPPAGIEGYNGLGMTPDMKAQAENTLLTAYKLSVMQMLLPTVFNLHVTAAQSSASADGVPSQAQMSFPSFGSGSQLYNQCYYESGTVEESYPDSQVMTTDILGNGANPFELFYGLNGWSDVIVYYPNLECLATLVNLFNATPFAFTVVFDPSQGALAGGTSNVSFWGANNPSGFEGEIAAQLPPYGYLPLYAVTTGGEDKNLTVGTTFLDPDGQPVAGFNFGADGCDIEQQTTVWDPFATSGYALSPESPATQSQSEGNPGGVWVTIYQP